MMKPSRIVLALFLSTALPLMAAACGSGEQTDAGYENTTVSHAHQHWSQGENAAIPFLMLDVRTDEEYADGHIPGARLIPVQELAKRVTEVPKDRQVYIYCHSGVRSARASSMLSKAGFTRIENIKGGIEAWKKAGYPVTK